MNATYSQETVVSADGTRINYRTLGHGPGLVLVHGGGQAAQNFMELAASLSTTFTIHIPDRRGRGASGLPGDNYGLATESQDLDAILRQTGSELVFGLSSGALICLDAAVSLRPIRMLALYEPPLSINHSTPVGWLARFDREIAAGRPGSAMITATRGTRTAPAFIQWAPRFMLAPLLNKVARGGAPEGDDTTTGEVTTPARRRPVLRALLWPVRRFAAMRNRSAGTSGVDDVPLSALVPTMHYDAQLVIQSEGRLPAYREIAIPVLLLGGSKSPKYLRRTLDALEETLPDVRRTELKGAGHLAPDNSGQPTRVADELRRFFPMGSAG